MIGDFKKKNIRILEKIHEILTTEGVEVNIYPYDYGDSIMLNITDKESGRKSSYEFIGDIDKEQLSYNLGVLNAKTTPQAMY
ncbi:MAG: hypothetical protein ACPG5O_15295 [Pseudoalteromonas tetraodonis]